MKREAYTLAYGETKISFHVVRRERKTLEIGVEPDASVTVVAPSDATLEAIESKVRKRARWIVRQQKYFHQFLPRMTERRFIAGETHLYLGRQYRLKVVHDAAERVKLQRGFLITYSRSPESAERSRELVEAWYRERARVKIPERIELCAARLTSQGTMRPKQLIIRSTKTRWGSMSPAGNLLINPKLLQAPVCAIDYVITHELCHLREPNHGPAFYELLNAVLPDWPNRKQRLEQLLA
jgi:predicted metal-dependent hydrolase